ncbi:2-oxoglutarate-Fe(II) type oxidoreductase [Thalictrum thalictroides]|uniref:2-oxoglutarate-Fe(II) type oxidoreductase n=1 Tax=Thalictrum thalictroides TaxID=46969 RepID=A0A7J6X0X1_THATH|nr:2-oxoglutarate-Fe(II) type oxidoreductase [Thalictrum thalictroides]
MFKNSLSMVLNHHQLPRYIRKEKDDIDAPINTTSIPIIDLHLLSSSSSQEKEKELEKLKSALTSWGLFQAIGHDIPSTLLDELQRTAKEFFDLPMEEKHKYSVNFNGKQDWIQGYGNDLIISDDQVIDWSDRLYLLVKPLDQRNYNLWPQYPTGFREILNKYSMKTHQAAEIVLKNMAKLLDLEENYFVHLAADNAPTFARFNYYPPCSRPDLVYGIKPHADGGAITIVLPDKEVEGLQVLRDDQWIKVPIIPDALIVNVADQIEIMSNGELKSPMHRVITNSEKQRISVAMFYLSEMEKCLAPAPELINEIKPMLFKKMKAQEYADMYVKHTLQGKRAIDFARV